METGPSRADWIRQLSTLSNREKVLERNATVPSHAVDDENLTDMHRMTEKMALEREKVAGSLVGKLMSVQTVLGRLKGLLDNVQPGEKFIEDLAAVMNEGKRSFGTTAGARENKRIAPSHGYFAPSSISAGHYNL